MNVAIIGASGYLGQEIRHQAEAAGHNTTGTFGHNERPGLTKFTIGESNIHDLLDTNNIDTVVWASMGYSPGAANETLGALATDANIRLIYVSSDAVTSQQALENNGTLGEYARMKQDEEKIVGDKSLILRVGPMYGETSLGQRDTRTQRLIELINKGESQSYWDNAYKSFTPVKAIASFIVSEFAGDMEGTYFLGPDSKESYYQFFFRQTKELDLNTALLTPTHLEKLEAKEKGVAFDTSYSTHTNTIKLSE